MKRAALILSIIFLLSGWGNNLLKSQDQPKPKKDTVNMDTNAKPEFYYAEEDEKAKSGNSTTTAFIIAGAVVIVVAAGVLLLRKKK